jgi:hypothetical protein
MVQSQQQSDAPSADLHSHDRGFEVLRIPSVKMCCVRFEVFTVVTLKVAIFWDVTPCGFCKNWRFGGMLILSLSWWKESR